MTWTPTRSCSTAPTGSLDLRTGELAQHNPGLLLTKMTGAPYHPDATGPAFAKFLQRVQPDPDMRAYLARLLGHALEGRVVSHILPIFHGEGGNGKGTLINHAVLPALGDYADAADADLLTARTFDAHPTGVADLCGLRLAVLHETDAGRHLAEGTVKRLTGGDRLKARRMREDFWSFDPSHTFVMLTNHRPIVTGTDEGIWRRLRLVPWEVVIPAADRDEELPDTLTRRARRRSRLARRRIPRLAGQRPARPRQSYRRYRRLPRRKRRRPPVPHPSVPDRPRIQRRVLRPVHRLGQMVRRRRRRPRHPDRLRRHPAEQGLRQDQGPDRPHALARHRPDSRR